MLRHPIHGRAPIAESLHALKNQATHKWSDGLSNCSGGLTPCSADALTLQAVDGLGPSHNFPHFHRHQLGKAESPFDEEGEGGAVDDKKSPLASRASSSMSTAHSSMMSSITQGSPFSWVTCASIAQVNLNLLSPLAMSWARIKSRPRARRIVATVPSLRVTVLAWSGVLSLIYSIPIFALNVASWSTPLITYMFASTS